MKHRSVVRSLFFQFYHAMSKLLRTLLLTAAATGAAALALQYLDLEAARDDLAEQGSEFPGLDPEDMKEDDVATLLNELASQL